ncbi:centrosomal protein POC5 isoform X3 [Oryzias latipes]
METTGPTMNDVTRCLQMKRIQPVLFYPKTQTGAALCLLSFRMNMRSFSATLLSLRRLKLLPALGGGAQFSRAEKRQIHSTFQVLSGDSATEAKDGRHSSRSVRSSHASPLIVEPSTRSRASELRNERRPGQSPDRASGVSDTRSDHFQVPSEGSRSSSPDLHESAMREIFITPENMSKMENILDTWSNNLKTNVLTELQKWKFAFMEQHRLEMMKERERHAAQTTGLKSELDSLKELLHTYETSNQRKDQVIVNLSQVLDKQKEKLEKMKALTQWRIRHTEAKEEAYALQMAQQHYSFHLKKKVWFAWHSLIEKHWKVKVERACRLRAEEVCSRLSNEYEAKLAEHCETIEKAQSEICRLRLEREQYEDSMKKAFMRGVCALNMEALSMFHSTEGRPEQPPPQEQHDFQQESATTTHFQPYPTTSSRFSPLHFDHPEPPQSEADDVLGSRAPMSQEEGRPPTTVVHSSVPLGGFSSSLKQVSGRFVTSSQQKPAKTVTARITARADVSKAPRANLQVMGVAPPMSSVIIERHHPISQLTIGQATAAKFPRSSQQTQAPAASRGSSRTHASTCHVHSIKVVE